MFIYFAVPNLIIIRICIPPENKNANIKKVLFWYEKPSEIVCG